MYTPEEAHVISNTLIFQNTESNFNVLKIGMIWIPTGLLHECNTLPTALAC